MRLRPGASMAAFLRAASALAKRYPDTGGHIDTIILSDEVAATAAGHPAGGRRAGGCSPRWPGLIALAIIGQLLSRQLILDAAEYPILRALGMTRARLVGAVPGAAGRGDRRPGARSPWRWPSRPPRSCRSGPRAWPSQTPGSRSTWPSSAPASPPSRCCRWPCWCRRPGGRPARAQGPLGVAEPAAPARASRLGSALGLAGSVTGGVGVRMAFEPGRGRTAVPVRSALVGITVAIAAVVAAVVFGTSLIALVGTPHRYGQNWDQELDLRFAGVTAALGAKLLSAEPAVTGYAAGDYGQLSIDGQPVAAIGISPVRGRGFLTLLAGRAPSGPGEIVLGAQTLRAIHRQLGQTVQVAANGAEHTMRIVGVAVFPSFGRGSFAATDLGTGAAVLPRCCRAFQRRRLAAPRATCYNFFLLRYRPGTDLNAAATRLTAAVIAAGCPPGSGAVTSRPAARRHPGLRRRPGHPADPGRRARAARGRHAGARAADRRAPSPPRPRGAQDPRPAQVAGAPGGVLAGQRTGRGGAAGRAAARRRGRPVVLGAVRRVSRSRGPVPTSRCCSCCSPSPPRCCWPTLIAAGPGWAAARIRPALVLRSE